jgi:3-phosphoshikimate 1-carboxyvinyltransferase
MKSIKIKPSVLKGKVEIPPSKSLSHRAIICASLCNKGQSILKNIILSEDIKATIEGMKKLGAEITLLNKNAYIKNNGKINTIPLIYCGESASTLRFLIPLSLVLTHFCRFFGSKKLFERPLDVYYTIFNKQHIYYKTDGSYPLAIKGRLLPGAYEIPGDKSSQFISGLLLSLPLLENDSKITVTGNFESKAYVDMTADIMEKFGVHTEKIGEKTFFIKGRQTYKSTFYTIEGDYSQAAFFLVANELGSKIECLGLNNVSLQADKEIINIIKRYKYENNEIIIDASQIPDLVPIITVLSSLKEKRTTVIKNAGRLHLKESDRLKAISTELNKLGAHIRVTEDGLVIKGRESLNGCTKVNSWNDHRIAMSLAIAATKCKNEIILENHLAVNKSYPHFWRDYKSLGGKYNELSNWK